LQHILRRVDLFGVAAASGAILVPIAVVQQKSLVLAAIAILALVIMAPVEMSFGVFAFSVPFDNVLVLGNIDTSHTSLSWGAGAFAGAVLLAYGLVNGRVQRPPRAALWWGLFSLWSVASIAWATVPTLSLPWISTVASLFGLYLITVSLRITRRELSWVLILATAGGAVAAAVLLYEAHHTGLQNVPDGRARIVFGNRGSNPNDLGDSLVLPFSLALGGILSTARLWKKALLLAILLLVATAVFLTMSRGSLVALCATLLVFLFRAGVGKRMLIPILFIVIPMLFLPDLFYERLKEAPTGRGTGRLDIFIAGTEVVKHNPVIGIGLANFTVGYNQYAGYAPVFRGYGRAAHNVYLEVWAETGIVGLTLLVFAIYSQMKRPRPNSRSRDYMEVAVNAGCWGLLVAGLSGNIQWSKEFWLSFILLTLITQIGQRDFKVSPYRDFDRGSRRLQNLELSGAIRNQP
jgi:O-antigen ligase